MPDNQQIQLLPESRKEIEVKIPGENRLLFLGFGLIILVLVLYSGLRFYSSSLQSKISQLDGELKSLDSKREKETEEKILLIKDQFTIVGQILNNHVILSDLLRKIQTRTTPQIQFKTLKLSLAEKKIDIETEAANYTVVARQIVSYLSEDTVKDVKINEIKLFPSGRLNLNMSILFNPDDLTLETINNKIISAPPSK